MVEVLEGDGFEEELFAGIGGGESACFKGVVEGELVAAVADDHCSARFEEGDGTVDQVPDRPLEGFTFGLSFGDCGWV